jgi:Trypsin-co-occurring domain 1
VRTIAATPTVVDALDATVAARWEVFVANKLVSFPTTDGAQILVEVDDKSVGFRQAGRDEVIPHALQDFEDALGQAHRVAEKAFHLLRGGTLAPDGIEIEFGIQLNAEFGMVVAKASAEGHFNIKLSWSNKDETVDPAK